MRDFLPSGAIDLDAATPSEEGRPILAPQYSFGAISGDLTAPLRNQRSTTPVDQGCQSACSVSSGQEQRGVLNCRSSARCTLREQAGERLFQERNAILCNR